MTDSKKEVANASRKSEAQLRIEVEAHALAEKQQARTRAEEVILSAIGRWTGIEVGSGDHIPVVRDGKQVGALPQTILTGNPIAKVTGASLIEYKAEIDRKIIELQSVTEAANALIKALGSMSYYDRVGLETRNHRPLIPGPGDHSASLEQRLIREIGTVTSAVIAASALTNTAEGKVADLNGELQKRKMKPGRPRNEAAHAVARELALLYAKITGKRPTYAAGADGFSGGGNTPPHFATFSMPWVGQGRV